MNKLALHLPINSVSLGQVSTLILKTLFEREKNGTSDIDLYLFAIANIDLSSQKIEEDFKAWLQSKLVKTLENYTKDIPVFKLWHLNQSLESYGYKQSLLSFYELDSPTKIELNIAKNNNLILSSEYACTVFKLFGVNCSYVPLAFDSYNFTKLNKQYHQDGRIVFNLCGKLEKRKHHAKVIQSWIKAFGNDRRYHLQCAIFNHFLSPEQNHEFIKQILGGDKPFNVNFFPNFKENYIYNDFLNSGDIVLGVSGGEGWGLPEFQSVAIGKHAVILDAHAYKGWANSNNSVLINPSGKIDSVDNIFFRKGDMFNQGNIFDWNEEEFIFACRKAITRVEKDRVNKFGLELQTKFNKEDFVNRIIETSIR
jgi:hypothetical protein